MIIERYILLEAKHQAQILRTQTSSIMDQIYESHEALRERARQLEAGLHNFLVAGNAPEMDMARQLGEQVMTAIKEGRL